MLQQFVLRRERQVDRARGFGLVIPDEVLASMLEEGAELGPHDRRNLRAVVGDVPSARDMACALRRLDVSKEGVTFAGAHSSRSVSAFFEQEEDGHMRGTDEVEVEDLEVALDSDDEREVLAELSAMDSEDDCLRVFAVLESMRRKVLAENRAIKCKMLTDRLPARLPAWAPRGRGSR